ncbi:MAG: hypothetical protein N2V78_08940 [Methanophagales archaeon]|nr:hypothetical protein [Methanophagales archaeon]
MNILKAIEPFMEDIEVKSKNFTVDDEGYANPSTSSFTIRGAVALRVQDTWVPNLPGITDFGGVRLYTDKSLDVGDQIVYHSQVYTITFKQDYYNLFGIYMYRLIKP